MGEQAQGVVVAQPGGTLFAAGGHGLHAQGAQSAGLPGRHQAETDLGLAAPRIGTGNEDGLHDAPAPLTRPPVRGAVRAIWLTGIATPPVTGF